MTVHTCSVVGAGHGKRDMGRGLGEGLVTPDFFHDCTRI